VTVGILHPGEMGSAIGAALRTSGHTVLWASADRSAATSERARVADLEDVGTVDDVARRSDVVISVCPPHAAAEVAKASAATDTIYVDANAISPAMSRAIGADKSRYVDGGIIGPPPRAAGTTRLYLSGSEAAGVATLFAGSPLDARVLSDRIGDASALKMVYAAWTKGTAALLLAIESVARATGVDDALHREWALSLPGLGDDSTRAMKAATTKGWRWVGEMEEIAATFAAVDQPDGFHRAAAEIFAGHERPVGRPIR
jgi:3-hydroxyisobutyrate dehydrogenase-like beta-hydroxyacid dehydrogenase